MACLASWLKWNPCSKPILGTCWPSTGVSWALRPRNPRKSLKTSGASGPRTPESLEKVLKRSRKVFFNTFSRFSGVAGQRPRENFSDFSEFRAQSSRETPVDGQADNGFPKPILLGIPYCQDCSDSQDSEEATWGSRSCKACRRDDKLANSLPRRSIVNGFPSLPLAYVREKLKGNN